MTKPSLKLSDEFKQGATTPAGKKGVPPPTFMDQAIKQSATSAERRASFVSEAQDAQKQLLSTGKGYEASDVHAYLKARISGNRSAKPKAGYWGR